MAIDGTEAASVGNLFIFDPESRRATIYHVGSIQPLPESVARVGFGPTERGMSPFYGW